MEKVVIVVEGKNDQSKLNSIFKDTLILTTNGSEIKEDTILMLKELSKNNRIILCLDPDGPGNIIRNKILAALPNCDNVYADKDKAISKNGKKVGIEHMSKGDIIALFSDIKITNNNGNIKYIDLYQFGLMDNKSKRYKLCDELKISRCNAKQLLKRLNMMGISLKEIEERV